MTISFSELWEKGEQKSSGSTLNELYVKLPALIIEYQKLDNITSKEIQKTLKTKKYGEILHVLTEISRIDDINSYAALMLELQSLEKA